MDGAAKAKILEVLAGQRILTVATLRPDGWPQATIVGYANDGLTVYFICGRESQKAANIARDNRISIAIGGDTPDPMAITGLSMAARAAPVTDPTEIAKFAQLMYARYPEYKSMPAPDMSQIHVMRVVPEVISLLDYTKGFAHTDLFTVAGEEVCQAA